MFTINTKISKRNLLQYSYPVFGTVFRLTDTETQLQSKQNSVNQHSGIHDIVLVFGYCQGEVGPCTPLPRDRRHVLDVFCRPRTGSKPLGITVYCTPYYNTELCVSTDEIQATQAAARYTDIII